ncbi:MAG: glycosyltransferase [Pseudomonadota bacterium]
MIRVMHVVLGLNIGGLETFVADLSSHYSDSVESLIVCLRGPQSTFKEVPSAEVIFLNGPDKLSLSFVRRLASIIREREIDVVHTHNQGPHLYGALAGRLTGRAVVHTKHGRNYPKRKKKVWLNRVATLFTNRVIAVSEDSSRVAREIERVPERKLATILNGIDTEKYVPRPSTGTLRAELGLEPDTPLIGIVARLSRVKNHPLLFRSMLEFKRQNLPLALCVVGDGPQGKALHGLVDELELQDSVFFLGAHSEVELLYREFDVFVLSSTSEGISLTLLEAMSCALPVVATRVGGNPEVVIDNATGLLVGEDHEQLADALRTLTVAEGCAQRRREMGEKGRERAMKVFSMDQTARAYVNEYNSLLAKAQ